MNNPQHKIVAISSSPLGTPRKSTFTLQALVVVFSGLSLSVNAPFGTMIKVACDGDL